MPPAGESPGGDTPLGEFTADELNQLAQWHQNGQLFRSRNYQAIRDIFAARFERDYAEVLKQAIDLAFDQWLREHAVIKAELYTAIDPAVDQVEQCLRLFEELAEF